jgi:2-phospho-L-lactate guanylyltransferase
VKAPESAKSRLGLPPHTRRDLAQAFALDVLATIDVSDHVGVTLLVTVSENFPECADRERIVRLRDRPLKGYDGLNGAVETGRRWAMTHRPQNPVVVVPADLPCLTSGPLYATLCQMLGAEAAFVPDATGSGTTLLSAYVPAQLRSAYGPDSVCAHTLLGATPIEGADRRARHDVDTMQDLAAARTLGLGPHTRLAVSATGT